MRTLGVLMLVLGFGLLGCAQKEKEAAQPPKKEKAQVKAEVQKAEPQKAEPQKAEPQKAEPQKAEPQKAEPQKAEPQKAELKEEAKAETQEAEMDFVHIPMDELRVKAGRFAPVQLHWNQDALTPKETEMVKKLVEAAKQLDEIFWIQTAPQSLEWRNKLETLAKTSEDAAVFLDYLKINYGPFGRLDAMKPFLGVDEKPKGANFYPTDMTKEEFDAWLVAHPADADSFKSNFTVIRREGDKLVAVPYSKAYGPQLHKAHDLLKEASELAENESLKRYLSSRADAFLSDDYFQSDMDWMDLDSSIEVTIGPYEVYEDQLFGYKAAFEAFITLKDPGESEKLLTFEKWLETLERNLPIEDQYKNFGRGSSSPMFIVDEIFTAGDTRAGVQTIAFNLPNDERVREKKGSKKVMLRNVGDAKFEKILTPIAAKVLAPELQGMLQPEAYSNHTLLHEISHGLGPGTIVVDGEKTTVNLALKNLYPHLEEAKADTLGLYNALFFIDEGVIQLQKVENGKLVRGEFLGKQEAKRAVVATFLAGIYRSTRFGVEEAHGKGNLLIFNYLREKGGFVYTESGKVTFDYDKTVAGVKELGHDILMIEALGDFDGCKEFIEKYTVMSPEMQASLDSLTDVPVDIKPIYTTP